MRKLVCLLVSLFACVSIAVAGMPISTPNLPPVEKVKSMKAVGACGVLKVVQATFDMNGDGDIDLKVFFAVDMDTQTVEPFLFVYFEPDNVNAIKVIGLVTDGKWEEMTVAEYTKRFPSPCNAPVFMPRA